MAWLVNLHHIHASYMNRLLKEHDDPNIFYYLSFPNSEVPSFLSSAFSPYTDVAHGAWDVTLVCYQNIVQISGCNHSTWTYGTHLLSTDTKSEYKHNKCLPYVGMRDFQTQVNHHCRYPSQSSLLASRKINNKTHNDSLQPQYACINYISDIGSSYTLCWDESFWGADEPVLEVSISVFAPKY